MLNRTPILRNLDYQTRWLGLTFDDMPFLMAPTGIAILFMLLFGLPPTVVVIVVVCSVVGLALFKHGKPEGYIWMLLDTLVTPRHLSHKAPDTQLDPLARLPAAKQVPNKKRGSAP